ncbi:hypothetical protein AVEN_202311-1, partial [Araneus ventricosus]
MPNSYYLIHFLNKSKSLNLIGQKNLFVLIALRRKSQSLTGALVNAVRRDNSPETSPNPSDPSPSTSAPPSPKTTTQLKSKVKRPWVYHLEENKTKWKERTHK